MLNRHLDVDFPVRELSEASQVEKRRKHGVPAGIHLWPGRRPQSVVRAALCAAQAEATSSMVYGPGVGFPLEGRRVLDPFGGGGTFALEALQLGATVVSNDLNPVAVLIQKVTVEYPRRYGMALASDVRIWGDWILRRSRAVLSEVYGPSGSGRELVGSLWVWGTPCPCCGKWAALLKNTCVLCNRDQVARLEWETSGDFNLVTGGMEQMAQVQGSWDEETCLGCGGRITRAFVREQGCLGRLQRRLLAVCERGLDGLACRLPTMLEGVLGLCQEEALASVYQDVPFGVPNEELVCDGATVRVPLFGLHRFSDLFLPRQLLVLGVLVRETRVAIRLMLSTGMKKDRAEAVGTALALVLSRTVERNSGQCVWQPSSGSVSSAFVRYAMPFCPDFAESNILGTGTGSYALALERNMDAFEHMARLLGGGKGEVTVRCQDAALGFSGRYDLVATDPPYFASLSYAAVADYFYVWLRRVLWGLDLSVDGLLQESLTPKVGSGGTELVVDARRHGGLSQSVQVLLDGSVQVYRGLRAALKPDGRMVLAFGCLNLEGWAVLGLALQMTGFRVRAVWPVHTELDGRPRARGGGLLSCSLWLSCDTKPEASSVSEAEVLRSYEERLPERCAAWERWGLPALDRSSFLFAHGLVEFTSHSQVVDEHGQAVDVLEFLARLKAMIPGAELLPMEAETEMEPVELAVG